MRSSRPRTKVRTVPARTRARWLLRIRSLHICPRRTRQPSSRCHSDWTTQLSSGGSEHRIRVCSARRSVHCVSSRDPIPDINAECVPVHPASRHHSVISSSTTRRLETRVHARGRRRPRCASWWRNKILSARTGSRTKADRTRRTHGRSGCTRHQAPCTGTGWRKIPRE